MSLYLSKFLGASWESSLGEKFLDQKSLRHKNHDSRIRVLSSENGARLRKCIKSD